MRQKNSAILKSSAFECRVRQVIHDLAKPYGYEVPLGDSGQVFPDVLVVPYGVEVKFTESDSWVCVANSIREKQRAEGVENVYLMFGKAGGTPEARCLPYEQCVVHVRTTHDPRFQVDMSGEKPSLFSQMGVSYDEFRKLDMLDKMKHVRAYAKKIHPDERLWWFGDDERDHDTDATTRLYTSLTKEEKDQVRAEAALLCPRIVAGSSDRHKYDDVVRYLVTYRGVIPHQARDLYSAGSAAGVTYARLLGPNRDFPYIARALLRIENKMQAAAEYLPDYLFEEYWGRRCDRKNRISEWLDMADRFAAECGWCPSDVLFVE